MNSLSRNITEKVLTFWFGPLHTSPSPAIITQWFQSNATFDQRIRDTFLPTYEQVLSNEDNVRGQLMEEPNSALAAVIVLDQFSRNMFRGTAQMFAADPVALQMAKQAISKGFHRQINSFLMNQFFFLPFMHSEQIEDHEAAVALYEEALKREEEKKELVDSSMIEHIKRAIDYEQRHFEIIKKFGRFPHRNEILGRESTPEERNFTTSF